MIHKINKEKMYIEENHLFQYKLKVLRREIYQYKKIEIPVIKITMIQKEFIEWFMGNLSPNEVDEVYRLIQKAKKRSADIKPILQTIALALVDRNNYEKNSQIKCTSLPLSDLDI